MALLVISIGIFLLAVLFTMIQGFGLYVSLALLVLGSFSMIIAGILRESTPRVALTPSQRVALKDPDDL